MSTQGPRVAIIKLADPEGSIPVAFSENVFELACVLMAERCAVSTASWKGENYDELFVGLRDADRILLWDPDVLFDVAATRFALGKGVKLIDAFDGSDVVSAPVMRDEESLAVFSGTECFSTRREGLGTGLIQPLRAGRAPLPFGAAGVYWLWLHGSALSRLAPPPERQQFIAGVDVTLSRRLIEGGCSVVVDPRLSVVSICKATSPWALDPVGGEEVGVEAEVERVEEKGENCVEGVVP